MRIRKLEELESDRLTLQTELDGSKTQAERNRLGQFATPSALANDILAYAETLLPKSTGVRFLDPAIGTGAFYSALRAVLPDRHVTEALGFEIDPHYGAPASDLWSPLGLQLEIGDFTLAKPDPRFNLVVCNPPYVRHHHLSNESKARLGARAFDATGMRLSGLAGLYCYFLGICQSWMAADGVAAWLIPSEFMDVNYGREVRRYLLRKVTLLHIHRFDPSDLQFADALVSSAIVWIRNRPPPASHAVRFTMGGSLSQPQLSRDVAASALAEEDKWTRFPANMTRTVSTAPKISDFFKIRRGLATGDNDFFILDEAEIASRGLSMESFRPILPSPRYIDGNEIVADKDGVPTSCRRLFLLDTRLSEEDIRVNDPNLARYLDEGRSRGLQERYLCRHRKPWYSQESRPPPPIVCTYLGRGDAKSGRPFRFLLNPSRATVANVFLAMYPTASLAQALLGDPGLIRHVWKVLNEISASQLLSEGRVYGGGLHKLEPKELANVPVPALSGLLPHSGAPPNQGTLLDPLVA